MEFRNSIHTTGVDIPAGVVEYVLSVGRSGGDAEYPAGGVHRSSDNPGAAR